MKILITAGGTQEPIDHVRRITNTSTGTTGHFIAKSLNDAGHIVFFLKSKICPSLPNAYYEDEFTTSDDLEKKIENILLNHQIDIVIQSAAVSDFTVNQLVINGELFLPEQIKKISSSDDVEIILKHRAKIITKIKNLSQTSMPIVIGFKLTNTEDEMERFEAVSKLSMNPDIDFIVHNDLSEITKDRHPTKIYFKKTILFEGITKNDLAQNIIKLIKNLKEAHTYDLMS